MDIEDEIDEMQPEEYQDAADELSVRGLIGSGPAMTDTAHTKGPWKVRAEPIRLDNTFWTLVVAENEEWLDADTPPTPMISMLPHRADTGLLPPSRAANAQLIAAAPELLEALRAYAEWRDQHGGPLGANEVPSQIDIMMDAAIAKATK